MHHLILSLEHNKSLSAHWDGAGSSQFRRGRPELVYFCINNRTAADDLAMRRGSTEAPMALA